MLGRHRPDKLRGASFAPSTGGRAAFWPVGTVHAAPHPPLRPRGPVQAALWGSGEEIAEPKALSSCACFPVPVPGPGAQQCCPGRGVGKCPSEGCPPYTGKWGKDKRGYFKFLSQGAVSGPVVRTSPSTAAIPPAVPRWTRTCTQRHRPWSRAGGGRAEGEQPHFRLEQ